MSTSDATEATKLTPPPTPPTTAAKKQFDEADEDPRGSGPSVEKPKADEVSWDSDDDPLNPMNWKASKRWLNLLIIAMMAFIT